MKPIIIAAALLLAASGARAVEDPVPTGPGELMSKIHGINQLEIRIGTIAASKADSAKVRRFGTLLARDHSRGDRDLLGLASRERIAIPAPATEAKDNAELEKLDAAQGPAFDGEFLKAMAAGHEKAVRLLTAARDRTGDPALKKFIIKLLPILEQHHALAMNLQRKTAHGG